MNTMNDMWESYKNAAVPKGASPLQIRETKRAFYSGAVAISGFLDMLVDDNISEPAAEAMFEFILKELQEFGQSGGML